MGGESQDEKKDNEVCVCVCRCRCICVWPCYKTNMTIDFNDTLHDILSANSWSSSLVGKWWVLQIICLNTNMS